MYCLQYLCDQSRLQNLLAVAHPTIKFKLSDYLLLQLNPKPLT